MGGFASVDLGLALNLVNLALNSSGEEFRDGLNCGSGVPRPEDLRCLVRRQCFFVLQLGQVLTVDDQLVASARGGSGLVRSGGEAVLATSLIPVESPPIKEESADIRGVERVETKEQACKQVGLLLHDPLLPCMVAGRVRVRMSGRTPQPQWELSTRARTRRTRTTP